MHALKLPISWLFLLASAACAPLPPLPSEAECTGWLPGDLVLTEFLADPTGTDTGKEYIELYNATSTEVDLAGLVLYHAAPDEKRHTLAPLSVQAGGHVALGDARGEPLPVHLHQSYGSGLGALRNGGGTIGIRCGAVVIDEVTYSGSAAGRARQLSGTFAPDATINDDENNWCDASTPIVGTQDFGSPGAPNPACSEQRPSSCIDAETQEERALVTPTEGALVISELMIQPSAVSAANGEWFELYATRDVDLNELTVGTASSQTTLRSPTCLRVRAGDYALIANKTDPSENGGLPQVTASIPFTLADTAGNLAISHGADVIDKLAWSGSKRGVALQLDPAQLTAAGNDDLTNFCLATESYGTGLDKGTPHAANPPCPSADAPGQCFDIEQGFLRLRVEPTAGDLTISEAMPDPNTVADAHGEWFELLAHNAVDLNGLLFTSGGAASYEVAQPECLHLGAGGFALFARHDDPLFNGGLPPVAGRFALNLGNAGGTLVMQSANATPLDTFTWAKAAPGVALQRDQSGGVCDATALFGDAQVEKGTPGAPNDACTASVPAPPTPTESDGGLPLVPEGCLDPDSGDGRQVVRPTPGQVVVTEIMADPAATPDATGEWIELRALVDADLNDLTLANEGSGSTTLSSERCLHLRAGEHALLARSADPARNGGLPFVTDTFGFTLANSGSEDNPRAVIIRHADVELDRVHYTATRAGFSYQRAPNAPDGDDAAQPSWCFAPAQDLDMQPNQYGAGDYGTPGARNEPCP